MIYKAFKKMFFVTLFWIGIAICFKSALAADITANRGTVDINGDIRAGDAERLAVIISKLENVGTITVSSSGGDVREALRIAAIVNELRVGVMVNKGSFCISACFFIFLEGYPRSAYSAEADGSLPSAERRQKRIGIVGIHRPYLKSTDGGSQALESQQQIMKIVRSHLASKAVPQYLVDEMMAHPSNDIYWLKERDLEALGEYEAGVEEALISKCSYKRHRAIFEERWTKEKKERMYECSTDYWEQKALPLQKIFISRLKSGHRPWGAK